MKKLPMLFLMLPAIACAQQSNPVEILQDTSFAVYSTFVKERKTYPFIRIVTPELPKGVAAVEDVVYCAYGARELHLALYYPEEQQERAYPGVILVHGGGWRSGNKSHQVPMAQQLAARGYVTAAVEYRLSPEALYPSAVYDLKAAVRWLRAHAGEFRIDPDRIAALGCSAGGQLVALLGTTNGQEKFEGWGTFQEYSSAVPAIIDIDGLLDFTLPESRLYDYDPMKPSAEAAWFGGSYFEKPALWKEASPVFYVQKKTPPILFINSSRPRFHAGRDEMVEKLKALGIYYEIHTLPDTPHPFWLFHPWFAPTLNLVVDFLDRVFKGAENQ